MGWRVKKGGKEWVLGKVKVLGDCCEVVLVVLVGVEKDVVVVIVDGVFIIICSFCVIMRWIDDYETWKIRCVCVLDECVSA